MKKVNKALSPEEATALSNIQSILSEILAMGEGGGEEVLAPEEVEMAEAEGMETAEEEAAEEKEVKMILKGIEETASDSATASDDAVKRMEEVQSEESEKNVNEVAKALILALGAGTVKKSAKRQVDPVIEALGKIVAVQKSSQDQLDELSTAFGHVLEGLGVTKQMEVAKSQVKKDDPIMNDNQAIINVLKGLINPKEKEETSHVYKGNSSVIKKNLGNRDVLKGLLGQ